MVRKFILITFLMCFASGVFSKDKAPRLRGFTLFDMKNEYLEIMKKDWNANSVRLMIRPGFVNRHKGYATKQAAWKDYYLKKLPAFLDKAKELKMAVILDLHDVPNDSFHPEGNRKERARAFWQNESNLKVLLACWEDLAKMCKDRKQVIWYDILNEPLNWDDFPTYPGKWQRWSQTVLDAIRVIDKTTPVVIEVGPGGLSWGFKDFKKLKGENIIYSTHSYQPHAYTHQGIGKLANTDLAQVYEKIKRPWPGNFSDGTGGFWDKKRLEDDLKYIIKFQKKHNVRIYIGEFGVARWAPNAAEYLRDSIELFEKHNWDWSYHAFRESSIWSAEHLPAFGKSQWAKGLTPRGKVLMKYFKLNKNVSK